ncbi:MAG: AhpC/TSA family protein [Bacteroidetes bacterium]|nr:AhpC/TSA family protein [Bacteroidota bacterium]
MKKLFYLLASAVIVVSCTSEPEYVVTGNLAGGDGTVVVLQKRVSGETVVIDSAVIAGEVFTFSGVVEYPEMVQLLARGKRASLAFYLENAKISITGHIDSMNIAMVTGSKTQDEVNTLNNSMKELRDRNAALGVEFTAAREAGDTAKMSALRLESGEISEKMSALNLDFVKTNTTSFHAPVLLDRMVTLENLDEMEGYLKAFSPDVAATKVAVDIADRIAKLKAVSVGQKAPDFTLNDTEGTPVTLYSKVGTKLLMLDFWASWCGPCRAVNPDKLRTYNDFKEKGFDIIAVSLDRNKEEWLKGIEEDQLPWTHVSALIYWDCPVRLLYGVNSIPASALIDENGVIVARNLRGQALYDKVSEILGN